MVVRVSEFNFSLFSALLYVLATSSLLICLLDLTTSDLHSAVTTAHSFDVWVQHCVDKEPTSLRVLI